MTSLAGLPVYLDLASILYLGESISTHLHVKVQGWTDEQIVMSLILLNLAGGESVDDLRILEADEGFCRILRRIEIKGLRRERNDGRQRGDGERKNIARSLPPLPSSDTLPPFMKTILASRARRSFPL